MKLPKFMQSELKNCSQTELNRLKRNLGGKILLLTKPKRNADFRAKPKGLCIFMKSLNLMDLALEQKKKKQNNKL